jgi:hypothetical protein
MRIICDGMRMQAGDNGYGVHRARVGLRVAVPLLYMAFATELGIKPYPDG